MAHWECVNLPVCVLASVADSLCPSKHRLLPSPGQRGRDVFSGFDGGSPFCLLTAL